MVRVVGNIRDYEGDRHVLVFEVFPLEDFNQLTHHILDVIFTHCKHSKGPIPVSICYTRHLPVSALRPLLKPRLSCVLRLTLS
jgi:hypothetical protein